MIEPDHITHVSPELSISIITAKYSQIQSLQRKVIVTPEHSTAATSYSGFHPDDALCGCFGHVVAIEVRKMKTKNDQRSI